MVRNSKVQAFQIGSGSVGGENKIQRVTYYECFNVTLAVSTQLQVIFIYRPHKVCTVVMSWLSEICTSLCSLSPASLLIGDLNIYCMSTPVGLCPPMTLL